MTISISAKKADGTFSYEVHNGGDLIEAGNGYPSQADAERQARVCYHELHRLGFIWNKPFAQIDHIDDSEMFNELGL